MGDNTQKIICSCCGSVVSMPQKFCPECGTPTKTASSPTASAEGAKKTYMNMGSTGMGIMTSMHQEQKAEPVNIYPDDSNLKLMVDCCDKTGPLAGGIVRSSEVVLYYDEKTDGYQVHTYASNGYTSGRHEGYYTTKEHAAHVLQSIDEDTLLRFKNLPTPVGGSSILKFRNKNDEMIRAQCSIGELSIIKHQVEGLLYGAVKPENRIVPKEAKNWKSCAVLSTGMSMDGCYSYELERMEDGKIRARGQYFACGKAHERVEWIELAKKDADELDMIPLGLMLSNIVTNPDLMMAAGATGIVLDGESLSVSITYANGKRDTKIPDGEMIRALDELMRRVL